MTRFDKNDLVGTRSGRLLIESYAGRYNGEGVYMYECQCDCGNKKTIARSSLIKKATKSCGCLWKERITKHEGSYDNAYWSWKAMHRRCYNPSHDSYKHYGGKGIKVCDRWHEYRNFKEDMGEREKGVSIDRIDGSKDYTPENCRWATFLEQSNNKSDNRYIEYKGVKYTCGELARKFGIAGHALNIRYFRLNWPIDEALEIKPRQSKERDRDEKGRYCREK